MILINGYSRLTCGKFLREKSEALEKFNILKERVENETIEKIIF
jgi:hypothetical protein